MDIETSQLAVQQGGYSLFALFWQAHLVVKIVMIGLIAASVFCWAIILEKFIAIGRASRAADAFEASFWSGQSMEDLHKTLETRNNRGLARIFMAGMKELTRAQANAVRANFPKAQQRMEKIMDIQLHREMQRLEHRLLVLATVGSTAPFIGLFGTVWGIMNSFRAIALSKNTNLAVVAPGLAEALFATALGLLSAIPAVMFYNKYANDIGKLHARFGNFIDEFSTIVERQLDETKPARP